MCARWVQFHRQSWVRSCERQELSEWKKIEDRQFRFSHARDGIVPEGRKAVPLGLLDRAGVRTWMGRMQIAFAPISSWIP
jgi:hypothetical protein